MAQFKGRQSTNVQDLRDQGPVGRFIDRLGAGYGNLGHVLAEQWKIGAGWDPYSEARSNYEAMFGPGSWERHQADVERLAPPNMSDREIDRSVYREPGYQPNYRSQSEIAARDFTQIRDVLNQRVEVGHTSREAADKIIEREWDNLQNQVQVDLQNGNIDAERAGGIIQRVQTGGPFDLNAPPGDSQFRPSQSGAASFAALPRDLPAIGPPSQAPVDPRSLELYDPNKLPDRRGLRPEVMQNPEYWPDDTTTHIFPDEKNPTRRQGVQGISADEREIDRSLQEIPQETIGTYSPPPDMAGAMAGGEKLSPAVVQTIIAESLGEGPEGMRLVAETIINRARDRGITPEEVVMERGQYAPHSAQYAAGSAINLDDPDNIAAATAAWGAAQSAEDPTMGSEYFSVTGNRAPTAGERLQPVWEHGNHTFYNDTSGVKVMQQNLAAAGLYDGAIDGDFGPATKAAADAFRAQLGTDDPVQALTALGAEPAVGQEAIQNILQSPESLPAFQQTAEAASPPPPEMAAAPLPRPRPEQAAVAPTAPPTDGLSSMERIMQQAAQNTVAAPPGLDPVTRAPVAYEGDYNDILDQAAAEAQVAGGPSPGGVTASAIGQIADPMQMPDRVSAVPAMPNGPASVDANGMPVAYAGDYNDIMDQANVAGISGGMTGGPGPGGITGAAAGQIQDPLQMPGVQVWGGPGLTPTPVVEGDISSPIERAEAHRVAQSLRSEGRPPDLPTAYPPDMADRRAGLTRAADALEARTVRADILADDTIQPRVPIQAADMAMAATPDVTATAEGQAPGISPDIQGAYATAAQQGAGMTGTMDFDPNLNMQGNISDRVREAGQRRVMAEQAQATHQRLLDAGVDPTIAWNEMQREMESIARVQPIGSPESPNYSIAQGLRPDVLQTVAIGGPDAPPPMATANVVPPSPQATADIGLTAMPPRMSSDAIFAPSEITPQQISDIERQRANPPAGGIRGWTYDQNGRLVAVGAPPAPAPVSAPAPAPAPAPTPAAAEPPQATTGAHGAPIGGAGVVRLMNTGAGTTRNQPLSPEAERAFQFVSSQTGLEVHVISGGQPAHGPGRTGSHRHDLGNAGDVKFYDPVGGRYLSQTNETDVPRMQEAVRLGVSAGFTGVGAGPGYMGGTETVHLGFGPGFEGAWGKGGKSAKAAPWIKEAYNEGAAARLTPEQVTAALTAPAAATEQTMLSQVDNSGQLLKMAQAAEDAGANNIEAVGGTVRVWQDAARTISGDWEQIEAIAAAGGPGVSIDYAQGVLSVASAGPQATTSATTATEGPVQTGAPVEAAVAAEPPAMAAPMSTMQDVARAASAAGVHHISVDPATNVMTGYNNNREPWTAEQQAQIAAAVPGITTDAAGGMRITPAPTTGLTDYDPNATTGTTTAVEAKPGGVQTTPVAEAAVPISPAPDAPPNMSAIPDAIQSQPTDPYSAAGQSGTGIAASIADAVSNVPVGMQSAPRNPYAVAEETATQLGQDITSGALGTGAGYDPALAGANTPAATATPPVVGATAPAPGTEPRVQLTAPAGPQYNVMPGVSTDIGPPGPENLGVLDAGPPVGPPAPVMTGKEKDDYLGPTQRMVQTVSLAPGDVAQPLRPGPGVELGPANVVPVPYAFTPPPMTGKEEDDYIEPALLPPAPAPAPAPEPPPQLPATQYVTPSVAVPAVVAPPPQQAPVQEKKTFQEKTEAASGRSKTFSDPIEHAARTATTPDGKFDHDQFWDNLGDVDLTPTQQTVAAKTAAQGHFTQNKLSGFLPNIGMPDMGGAMNAIQGAVGGIPNPVQGISNFFGGIFGGNQQPSYGIGSDYAASQSGNYNSFAQQGPPGSSGNYGGSYSGPGSGSYGGGGMGGSQYGGGYGGGGGYSGGGTYGGAGGQNIGQGIGGAYRNR